MKAVNQGSNMLRFLIWRNYKLPSVWTNEWDRGRNHNWGAFEVIQTKDSSILNAVAAIDRFERN